MNTDAPAALSLTEAARAIRAGRLSSVELTASCIDRLERVGRRLNYVAAVDPERALADARRADDELAAGRPHGPLHGVPLAHKDMFYRAGRVSACGSRICADFVPDVTATVLTRLDAAGALDIARLNMVEFGLGTTGHNALTGTPRNPWQPDHITGGSSSGPAGAVAARVIPASLGSDTGGSVRIPASCCGLVAMKPTAGRLSRFGALPLSFTLDSVGVLTRTVADCALMIQAMAGHDPLDPSSSMRPVDDYLADLEGGVRGLRIAVDETYFYAPVEDPVAALMRESLEVYRRLGAQIVHLQIPDIELSNPLASLIIAVEGASAHSKWLRERRDDYGPQTLGRLLAGLEYPAVRYVEALKLRHAVLAKLAEAVFAQADLLHAPVMPFQVPTIAESDVAANPGFSDFIVASGHCTRPFNYLGLPALSVPAGFTPNGLPCGFQLVGRPFAEALLFRAARAYERETGCTAVAPPAHA